MSSFSPYGSMGSTSYSVYQATSTPVIDTSAQSSTLNEKIFNFTLESYNEIVTMPEVLIGVKAIRVASIRYGSVNPEQRKISIELTTESPGLVQTTHNPRTMLKPSVFKYLRLMYLDDNTTSWFENPTKVYNDNIVLDPSAGVDVNKALFTIKINGLNATDISPDNLMELEIGFST